MQGTEYPDERRIPAGRAGGGADGIRRIFHERAGASYVQEDLWLQDLPEEVGTDRRIQGMDRERSDSQY